MGFDYKCWLFYGKYLFWRVLDPAVRLELRFPHGPAAPPQGEVLDLSKRSCRIYTCQIRGKKEFPSQWDGPSDSSSCGPGCRGPWGFPTQHQSRRSKDTHLPWDLQIHAFLAGWWALLSVSQSHTCDSSPLFRAKTNTLFLLDLPLSKQLSDCILDLVWKINRKYIPFLSLRSASSHLLLENKMLWDSWHFS